LILYFSSIVCHLNLELSVEFLDVIQRGNSKKDITELDRLSFTVRRIEALCAVIPKESFKATPNDELVPNMGFRGLKLEGEGVTLKSFRHFREIPQELKIKKKVENGSDVNFLDELDNDIPTNSWSLKIDSSKLNVR
jgi:radial spoke head protein 9